MIFLILGALKVHEWIKKKPRGRKWQFEDGFKEHQDPKFTRVKLRSCYGFIDRMPQTEEEYKALQKHLKSLC